MTVKRIKKVACLRAGDLFMGIIDRQIGGFNYNMYEVPKNLIIEQVEAHMRELGISPHGNISLIADGYLHRYTVEGDSTSTKNGAYRIHTDGVPAWYLKDWKRGIDVTGKFDASGLTGSDSEAYNQRINDKAYIERSRILRETLERKEKQKKYEATQKAKELYEQSAPATPEHEYLIRKRITNIQDFRLGEKGELLIPLHNAFKPREFMSLQQIYANGKKYFFKDTSTGTACYEFEPEKENDRLIIITEGVATGETIYRLTGKRFRVVCAMNCNNLQEVTKGIKSRYPRADILIGADNDLLTYANYGHNPGRSSAEFVVKCGHAKGIIIPSFLAHQDGSDWNDYEEINGSDKTQAEISRQINAVLSHSEDSEQKPEYEVTEIPHDELMQLLDCSTEEENTPLFTQALSLLKQYGEKKARDLYDKACEKCNPPLPAGEVIRTWNRALNLAKGIEDRVRERQRKVLTLRVIEQTLRDMNISVRFNVITKAVEISALPPDNENAPEAYYSLDETARLKATSEILPSFLMSHFKSKNYGVSDRFITDAISALASTNPLNPVLDLLNATTWDGHDRIADLYPVLGITNDMHRSFLRKWLHQAVSLALNDAGDLNSDFVLVLQGRQGLGKTNFFRALAMRPDFFQDGAVIDMRNKDTIIQATSTWITELGELDATLKKEQASLKAFITANFDTYRKPYARKAEKIERRTCFCATVNPTEAIRDDTGSRRYAFIHIDSMNKDFLYNVMTPEWCAQLWRQVYETLYLRLGRKGFYLNEEERAFIEASNNNFTVMLDGESELLDGLEWESDIDSWRWTTIKALEARCLYLKDKRIDTRKIGRALTKILSKIATSRGTTVDEYKRLVHGRTQYWLPGIHREEDE